MSVSGVLGVRLNLRFELPSDTFERRMIGPMLTLADPHFLVAASIYEGLSVLRRKILVLGLPWTWNFVDTMKAGLGLRRVKVPPFCAKRGLGLYWLSLITNW